MAESSIGNGSVTGYAIYVMFLLVSVFSVSKVDRFLLATTSQPLARGIKFGDKGCLPYNSTFYRDYKDFCAHDLKGEVETNHRV